MRQVLTAVICISIFLTSTEAFALFGRRGPLARLVFGPGPQIIGGGRFVERSRMNRCVGNCRPMPQRQGCSGGNPGGQCGGRNNPQADQDNFNNNGVTPNFNNENGQIGNGQTGGAQGGIIDPSLGGNSNQGPIANQPGGNSEIGTPGNGNHGGTTPTPPPPGNRPTNPVEQTIFSKWKGDFTAESAVKATNEQIKEIATTESESKKYNYTVIEQDCISRDDQNKKNPTKLILFSSKSEEGKDQSHLAFVPADIKPEEMNAEVEAAWKRAAANPNVAGSGKLRDVLGDTDAFYTTFSIDGYSDYPETQVQLKKIVKNGQVQFMSRYVHKHKTSVPDNRYKVRDNDIPYYCENKAQATGPDVSKAPAEKKPVDTSVVDASAKSKQIFVSRCVSCHDSSSGRKVTFDSEGNLLSGDPSLIVKRVSSGPRQMPLDEAALSASEIASIRTWSQNVIK